MAIFDQRAARRLTKRFGGFRVGASSAGASAVNGGVLRPVRAKGVGRESGGLTAFFHSFKVRGGLTGLRFT